jgi:hypothetical protein
MTANNLRKCTCGEQVEESRIHGRSGAILTEGRILRCVSEECGKAYIFEIEDVYLHEICGACYEVLEECHCDQGAGSIMTEAFTVEITVAIVKPDRSLEYSYRTGLQDADERSTIFPDRASADRQVRSLVLKLRKMIRDVPEGEDESRCSIYRVLYWSTRQRGDVTEPYGQDDCSDKAAAEGLRDKLIGSKDMYRIEIWRRSDVWTGPVVVEEYHGNEAHKRVHA